MEHINPRDLPLGHDEACAADLGAVCDSRRLGRHDAAWLARAVAGAIRPSRDRPLWDLAHAIAALGVDGRGFIDLALDTTLASAAALQDRLGNAPGADDRGLVLDHPRPWRASWAGLARLLSLAEFLLTAEDCAGFATLAAQIGAGLAPSEAPDLARRLASQLGQYRNAHMPLAPIERRFRAIRGFLRDSGKDGGQNAVLSDDDIVAFWQSDAAESTLFTTIVEHFITYERAADAFGTMALLARADSLETIENWEDRLEAITLPIADAPVLADALETLADLPDGPKLLTGAEYDTLAAVLSLDPYHRKRPLTVLRARAFGRIQSGIANRLRRGTGGPKVSARVTCAEVDYDDLIETVSTLAAHLRRCLMIALALRSDGGSATGLAREGEQELKRIRRAGFDAPRTQLAASIALVDGALATATEGFRAHGDAIAGLAKAKPLEGLLAADRATFSAAFRAIYADAIAQEAAP
jgi:hypothetical protein